MKAITTLIALALFGCYAYWLSYTDEHTVTTTVHNVEKISQVSGHDGHVSTYVYYLVSTDHGTYRIGIDGLFAHPEYAGRIKPGETYELTVIGKSMPGWGVYPRVKEMHSATE